MSDVKHTPGPWVFRAGTEELIAGGRLLLLVGTATPMIAGPRRDEARANGRLIAAAPDLLEALQLVCDLCDAAGMPLGVAGAKARAAIAKAEGRS